MVVLAVKLLPGDSSYYYKLGVSTEDIVQGKLKPNGLNATWISGTPDPGTVITGVYFSKKLNFFLNGSMAQSSTRQNWEFKRI